MQGYSSAPPRVGKVKGEDLPAAKPSTGLVGKAMGSHPVKQNPNLISVKSHTRARPGKGK